MTKETARKNAHDKGGKKMMVIPTKKSENPMKRTTRSKTSKNDKGKKNY